MIVNFRNRLRGSSYWRNIAWQASGNGLAQAVGVLGMPLLTRLYTPHDFAVQALFLQVVMFVAGLMTWRYEYFIQLPKEDIDSRNLLYLVLLLGFLSFVLLTPLCWIFSDIFSRWLGDSALASWLVFAPFTALLTCYSVALQNWLQRRKNYRLSGLSELAGKSTYIGCGAIGSWLFGGGATGLITALAFSPIGKILLLLELDKKWMSYPKFFQQSKSPKYSFSGIRRLAKNYSRLSGSMVFSHVMVTGTTAAPAIFIAHAYGLAVLGQFALVGSTIYLPAGLVGAAVGQVYYQSAAERWANGQNIYELWHSTAKRLMMIGLPMYIGTALIAPIIYPIVFGSKWLDAGHYATLMAIAGFFSFSTSPLDRTCLVVNAWWYPPLWHTGRAVSTICIIGLTWLNNWSFNIFLMLLVTQMSIMYLIDFFVERYFSLNYFKS